MPEQQEKDGWQKAIERIEEAKRSNAPNLELDALKLTALPESFGQLVTPEYLDLSGNQFTAMPEPLKQFAKLTIINLRDNQLTALPESKGRVGPRRVIAVIPPQPCKNDPIWGPR
jgi:Leucine-rich repeat (LRR) protein